MQHALRLFFMLLMLAAASGKLLNMAGFYPVVASYQLLPQPWVTPSAWALALTELLLGLWLFSGRQLRRAALALIALHLFYLLGLLQALLRGLSLKNCGCFGVYWPRPLSLFSPLEDLGLLLLAWAYWRLLQRARA